MTDLENYQILNINLRRQFLKFFLCKKDKNSTQISPYILAFHEVYKGHVHHPVAARCGIVSSKEPINQVTRAGIVQVFKGLINHFYRNRYLFRINELGNLCRYLLRSKRAIYILDNVFSMQFSLFVEETSYTCCTISERLESAVMKVRIFTSLMATFSTRIFRLIISVSFSSSKSLSQAMILWSLIWLRKSLMPFSKP